MNIAVVGAGRIGSTFAFHLARGGHDVTLIARGKRLEELQSVGAIETVRKERATVKAAGALDPATPWDLVLVTVLAHQAPALLPELKASAAKSVMFMFNTVASLAPLRDAVGAQRFEFGFPTVVAKFVDGKLDCSVSGPGQMTTVTSAAVARTFVEAKIPTEVHADMESFLRSHAAFVIPLMAIGCAVVARGAGISFGEARRYARVLDEAFAVVRKVGNAVTPTFVSVLSHLPSLFVATIMWAVSRSGPVRDLGSFGPTEVRELIDGMNALAPGASPEMTALRP